MIAKITIKSTFLLILLLLRYAVLFAVPIILWKFKPLRMRRWTGFARSFYSPMAFHHMTHLIAFLHEYVRRNSGRAFFLGFGQRSLAKKHITLRLMEKNSIIHKMVITISPTCA